MRGTQGSWALWVVIAAKRENMDVAPLLGFSLISSPRVAGESRQSRLARDGLDDTSRIFKQIERLSKF
jgi:hypothetical protein